MFVVGGACDYCKEEKVCCDVNTVHVIDDETHLPKRVRICLECLKELYDHTFIYSDPSPKTTLTRIK